MQFKTNFQKDKTLNTGYYFQCSLDATHYKMYNAILKHHKIEKDGKQIKSVDGFFLRKVIESEYNNIKLLGDAK